MNRDRLRVDIICVLIGLVIALSVQGMSQRLTDTLNTSTEQQDVVLVINSNTTPEADLQAQIAEQNKQIQDLNTMVLNLRLREVKQTQAIETLKRKLDKRDGVFHPHDATPVRVQIAQR